MVDAPEDLARAIAELRRDSRRFQEEMAAVRRDSRRFQESIDQPIREARRFQEELRKDLLALLRSWRRDPYWVLLNPLSTFKQRRTAARRIAAVYVPLRFKNPAVRKVIRELPAAARESYPRQRFEHALVAAGNESTTPLPRIRLGRRWVKDRDGRIRSPIAPLDLSEPQVRRWLVRRAWRLTEIDLLAGTVKTGRLRRALGGKDVGAVAEYRPPPLQPLATVRLSKRERQLCALLVAGVSDAEAAKRLRVKEGTIRVYRSKIRKKRGEKGSKT